MQIIMINIFVYCLINYVFHTSVSYCVCITACDGVLEAHCKLVPVLNGLPSQNKVIHSFIQNKKRKIFKSGPIGTSAC